MNQLLLTNANVVDIETGSVASDRFIAIEDGSIKDIGDGRPSGTHAQTIDLRGRTVIPGLIDSHVHVTAYSPTFAELASSSPTYVGVQAASIMSSMLQRGFTSVRDVGGADFGLARAVEEGLIDGPRLFFGGKALSSTGGHGDMRGPGMSEKDASYGTPGLGVIVDGIDEVRRAAREEVRRGANHIKFMGGGGASSPTDRLDSDQFSEEEIAAIVQEARMANIYAVVHAYTARQIERSVRLGVRSIEHCNFIDEPTAKFLKSSDAFMVPTLIAYRAGSKFRIDAGMSSDHRRQTERAAWLRAQLY
ncbi:amidohydrolase family protein [Rhizobium nepotum]|uniref:metal-dependent hydrolase family protein n=1 Tax=Rhizobium nepotum TaxID=1035271 RepID=UPI003CFAF9D4